MSAVLMPGGADGSWRSRLPAFPKDRDGLFLFLSGASQVALVAVACLTLAIVDQPETKHVDDMRTMQISVIDAPSVGPKPSVQMAAPKAKAAVAAPKPDEAIDQTVADDDSDRPIVDAKPVGGPPSSPGGLIWTPPAPTPNAPLFEGVQPDQGKRVVLPVVEMKKGAADPQLVSYDQGRFTDAASMREASQLAGSGSIVMNVSVSASGVVTQCATQVSSGSAVLDQKGCDLVRSYKYRPAQDADGKPKSALVSEVLEWAKDGKFSDVAAGSATAGAVKAMPKTSGSAPVTSSAHMASAVQPIHAVIMPSAPHLHP